MQLITEECADDAHHQTIYAIANIDDTSVTLSIYNKRPIVSYYSTYYILLYNKQEYDLETLYMNKHMGLYDPRYRLIIYRIK
jgi:uncharacterized protein YigE (DUF2233 family)